MQAIQWFLIGVLFSCTVFGLTYISFKIEMKWWGWATVVAGAVLVLFGLGWAGSSFAEGVPQSGAMGLIFFCGPGILMIAYIWRSLVAPQLSK